LITLIGLIGSLRVPSTLPGEVLAAGKERAEPLNPSRSPPSLPGEALAVVQVRGEPLYPKNLQIGLITLIALTQTPNILAPT